MIEALGKAVEEWPGLVLIGLFYLAAKLIQAISAWAMCA